MRIKVSAIALILLLPLAASGQQKGKSVYTYEDEDGVTVITDRPPPESSEFPKAIINEHGVTVGEIAGKKTAEQIAAEEREKELATQKELQRRADQALLATYVNVDEIIMHRDRRVELFQAQARVTELYLRNTQRRLTSLEKDARRYKPYSSDPNAPIIEDSLLEDIRETQAAIVRQKENLDRYRTSQEQIITRFEGDITRFKVLKGID
jgi:hypothetical protein